ncbi:MAG: hypothetical protein P4L69_16735 [Desulfosporosinus sp.]|nr:hypothetical protein [Desulfosporosinus sp.]
MRRWRATETRTVGVRLGRGSTEASAEQKTLLWGKDMESECSRFAERHSSGLGHVVALLKDLLGLGGKALKLEP